MFYNKKEMSFLKINDPLKRDAIVKEYLELKKKIRSNFLSERIGESELQTNLSKFYRPITETQKATTREITEGLKPISEELKPISEGLKTIRKDIYNIPDIISDMEAIKKYGKEKEKDEEDEEDEEKEKDEEDEEKEKDEEDEEKEEQTPSPKTFGKTAYNYIHGKEYYDRDNTFGIHLGKDGNYHMGATKDPNGQYRLNKKILTIAYNNIYIDGEKFTGTDGLWELIMENKPNPKNYEKEDLDNYGKLLIKTNALHHNFNPDNPNPRASKSYKWENILSPIWAAKTYEGKGVVVIPSDPNALLERLDLLLASQEAGHTGVRNELVSICDELKRQGVLDTKAYKKLNHLIKK